jgi:hypothetical protein
MTVWTSAITPAYPILAKQLFMNTFFEKGVGKKIPFKF